MQLNVEIKESERNDLWKIFFIITYYRTLSSESAYDSYFLSSTPMYMMMLVWIVKQ
jgi:hypothetical protein